MPIRDFLQPCTECEKSDIKLCFHVTNYCEYGPEYPYIINNENIDYSIDQYKNYISFYKKLRSEDKLRLCIETQKLINISDQKFFVDEIDKNIFQRCSGKCKFFIHIPEIVKILVLDYGFPHDYFPNYVIEKVNFLQNVKSARK